MDIAEYLWGTGKPHERNPYLDELWGIVNGFPSLPEARKNLYRYRNELIGKYAFSIPTDQALHVIAGHSPIIEIGAGSGYWAMCLSDLGADIIAVDSRPPGMESMFNPMGGNGWFDDVWFPVDEGDESDAGAWPERSLFLCWPPPGGPMAYCAYKRYLEAGGRTLIFAGDRGACGDDMFSRVLNEGRSLYAETIPSWPGMEEELVIRDLSGP